MSEMVNFSSKITELFIYFNTKRVELKIIKSNVAIARGFASKTQGQIDELISIMRQLNLQGNTDTNQWDIINRMIEGDNKLLEEHNSDAEKNDRILIDLQISIMEEMMVELPQVNEIYLDLLSSLRNELGMEINIDLLKKQFQKNQEKMQRSLKSSVTRFQEMLAEYEQKD